VQKADQHHDMVLPLSCVSTQALKQETLMTSSDVHSTAHPHVRYRQANRIVEEPPATSKSAEGSSHVAASSR